MSANHLEAPPGTHEALEELVSDAQPEAGDQDTSDTVPDGPQGVHADAGEHTSGNGVAEPTSPLEAVEEEGPAEVTKDAPLDTPAPDSQPKLTASTTKPAPPSVKATTAAKKPGESGPPTPVVKKVRRLQARCDTTR